MVIKSDESIHVSLNGRRLIWLKGIDGTGLTLTISTKTVRFVLSMHLVPIHLLIVCDDGKIRRYHEVIGTVDDLVFEPGRP